MSKKTDTTATHKPVIVTGLSGAGISSILKGLEDLGFEVFDNFPLSLASQLAEESADRSRLAMGIDTRTRGFSPKAVLQTAKNLGAFLIYITCDDAVLQKRFTETRRRHPLAKERPINIGIEKERQLLAPLKDAADLTIDSTNLSIHDLRHILEGHFEDRREAALNISLISFGFRHGLPREADIVMDVRFLQNPHWVKELKDKTGLDSAVGAYIEKDSEFETFMTRFQEMLKPLIPRYAHEGKRYLTLAVGCTGGQHRSVFCAEQLGEWLKKENIPFHITHRDVKK